MAIEIAAPTYPNFLREWIEQGGYRVLEVAVGADVPRSSLYRYLDYKSRIAPDHLARLSQFFGCSPEDLVPRASIKSDVLQSSQSHLWILAGRETLNELRREILRFAAAGALLVLHPTELLNVETVERIAKAVAKPSRTDEETLAALEAITQNCWSVYRATTTKIDLLSGVVGHLQTVRRLLHHAPSGRAEQRIWSMVSHTAQIAGEVVFDVQDCDLANEYYQLAIDSAQLAGDTALRAVALGRQGFLPVYQREFGEALPILEEAAKTALHTATPTARAWIAMMQAEAFANLGEAEACRRVIGYAEDTLAQARPKEDTLGTGFTYLTLVGYRGICHLRLREADATRRKDAELAQQSFEESLTAFVQPTRRRAMLLSDLATSLAYQGKVEEACSIATECLALAGQTRSTRAIQRLSAFQRSLAPQRHEACVKEFRRQLRDLQAAKV